MKKENKNNWENWASLLHGDEAPADLPEENGEDKRTLQKIYSLKSNVNQVLSFNSPEAAWSILKRQITGKNRRLEFLKYAAIFLISLLVSSSLFWMYDSNRFDSSKYASITSPHGQITNVTLFDGTNIWMNAGSSIKYRQSFNQKNREIILDGEALFSVTENKELPFVVNAGKAQVKVFGTEFNVKAYANESVIETVLLEGKVEFSSNNKSVIMKPGEYLKFTKANGKIVRQEVKTDEYVSWKGGKIFYDNEELLKIAQQLERWYEVKFEFENDQIKAYRFTGVVNKSKSLKYVLALIQEINKVEFEDNDGRILIKNK